MDLFDLKPCPECNADPLIRTTPTGTVVQCTYCTETTTEHGNPYNAMGEWNSKPINAKAQAERKAMQETAKLKADKGELITEGEFRVVGKIPPAPPLYERLRDLHKDGVIGAKKVYQFAKFRWCWDKPDAVICAKDTSDWKDASGWHTNTCSAEIDANTAKMIINGKYGFEASRIWLPVKAYYESSDWNFIKFDVAGYDYLLHDGTLYFSE